MKEKYGVFGMSCAACSAGIERTVGKLKGVTKVEVGMSGEATRCQNFASVGKTSNLSLGKWQCITRCNEHFTVKQNI